MELIQLGNRVGRWVAPGNELPGNKQLKLKALLDRLARTCGYFTSDDVRACVESAEREALKGLPRVKEFEFGEAAASKATQPLPPGYVGYFVAYSYVIPGQAAGNGCIEIGRSQTIRSFSDVQAMTRLIESTFAERYGGEPKVVVLNWLRYELPFPPDGGQVDEPADEASGGVVLRLVA